MLHSGAAHLGTRTSPNLQNCWDLSWRCWRDDKCLQQALARLSCFSESTKIGEKHTSMLDPSAWSRSQTNQSHSLSWAELFDAVPLMLLFSSVLSESSSVGRSVSPMQQPDTSLSVYPCSGTPLLCLSCLWDSPDAAWAWLIPRPIAAGLEVFSMDSLLCFFVWMSPLSEEKRSKVYPTRIPGLGISDKYICIFERRTYPNKNLWIRQSFKGDRVMDHTRIRIAAGRGNQ